MLLVHICVLLLVALTDLCIFIVASVDFVYMCGLVFNWVRLCFWESVLACLYVCLFGFIFYMFCDW